MPKRPTFSFQEQLEVGSRGEELFAENYPRKLDIWPGRDGDFVVRSTGQKLELKSDTYNIEKTPYFFIERYSDFHKKSPGSIWQAQEHGCEIFCYYFVRHDTWFEFRDIPALIARVESIAPKGFVLIKNKAWITAGWKILRTDLEDLYDEWSF
jgi:hypothetical protein